MQAVDDLGPVRMSREKRAVAAQRVFERALIKLGETGFLGSLEQIPPPKRGFQLITAGRTGPTQRLMRKGTLVGQGQDWVVVGVARSKVSGHGTTERTRDIEELRLVGRSPRRQEPANDDAAIEEVGESAI